MSSPEAPLFSEEDERSLLDVATASIRHGLECGRPLGVLVDSYPPLLRDVRATFVTLRIDGKLRGCMGALKPAEPLVIDVACNAFSAAFRDPRFERLTPYEFEGVSISISILSVPEPILAATERELINLVRPGIDGVILYAGERRATLLPAVWESIPEPYEFLGQLKRKAGLSVDYWSNDLRFERYNACSINRPPGSGNARLASGP